MFRGDTNSLEIFQYLNKIIILTEKIRLADHSSRMRELVNIVRESAILVRVK
jgi:hypothetical protein